MNAGEFIILAIRHKSIFVVLAVGGKILRFQDMLTLIPVVNTIFFTFLPIKLFLNNKDSPVLIYINGQFSEYIP